MDKKEYLPDVPFTDSLGTGERLPESYKTGRAYSLVDNIILPRWHGQFFPTCSMTQNDFDYIMEMIR